MKSIAAKDQAFSTALLFKLPDDNFDNLSCSLSDQLNDIPEYEEIKSSNELNRDDANGVGLFEKIYHQSEDFNSLPHNYDGMCGYFNF